MVRPRILERGDEAAIDAFCHRFPNSTMFLQANLREHGLAGSPEPVASVWVGVEDDAGMLVGVMAHDGQERLVLELPTGLADAVRLCVEMSRRPVSGILGPRAQVVAARTALGGDDWPVRLDSRELLFALRLRDLRMPGMVERDEITARRATFDDMELLFAWRTAYEQELGGFRPSLQAAEARRRRLERGIAQGRVFLLHDYEQGLAMAAFNAVLPNCVQIGGVFTPPELRSQGFARAVVAGALREARYEGVARSVLFTAEGNVPAQLAYRKIGYEEVGDYGITVFDR
ncbi:MAG: GNAT family N-acetyltransferase [Myxococcota bacterium]